MPYTPPSKAFVDNTAPVGGGAGQPLDAAFFTALVAGVDDADTRLATLERGTFLVTNPVYGADPTGAVDATAAIQAAMGAAAATSVGTVKSLVNGTTGYPLYPTVYIPAGTYTINASLVLPLGVNLHLSPNAIIRASTAISAPMLTMNNSTGVIAQHFTIQGGVWDANYLAQDVISLPYFAHAKIKDVRMLNAARHFVVLGDPAATSNSYEAIVTGLDTQRDRGQNAPTGSYGVWLRNASDCEIDQAIINGVDVGTRADLGGQTFRQVHVWNYGGSAAPTISFDDSYVGGHNTYIGCYADGPSAYAWRLREGRGTIVGCRAYLTPNNTTNTSVAVRNDNATGRFTILGLSIETAGPTWAADVQGDVSEADIFLRNAAGATTTLYNGQRSRSRGLLLQNPSVGQTPLIVRRYPASDAPLMQFQDTTSTAMATVTKDGAFVARAVATGLRPTAASVGAGGQIYDTTLSKPIWSDGTTWRDAAGIAV